MIALDHTLTRVAENLVARVTGPMKFRLVLQPAMATFFAIRDGLKDAQECKPPYSGPFSPTRANASRCWRAVGRRRKSIHPRGRCSTWCTSSSNTGGQSIPARQCWSQSSWPSCPTWSSVDL